jgi:hypothetical protein
MLRNIIEISTDRFLYYEDTFNSNIDVKTGYLYVNEYDSCSNSFHIWNYMIFLCRSSIRYKIYYRIIQDLNYKYD